MEKRKLDNLEKDVIAAMNLGYGVHYGRYKADHPFTRDADATESVAAETEQESDYCLFCGKEFIKNHASQKYCSDVCHMEAIRKRAREYYIKRNAAPGQIACADCGKIFQPTNNRQIYCCKACAGRAKRKRDKLREKEAE